MAQRKVCQATETLTLDAHAFIRKELTETQNSVTKNRCSHEVGDDDDVR
jgi:hypothetical protein